MPKLLFALLLFIAFPSLSQSLKLILPSGHSASINTAAFSVDGKKMITGTVDGIAKLWDVETGKLLLNLKHPSAVNAICFSSSGDTVAIGSADGTLWLWKLKGRILLWEHKAHTGEVTSLQWNTVNNELLSASTDNSAKIWEVENKKEKFVFTPLLSPGELPKWDGKGVPPPPHLSPPPRVHRIGKVRPIKAYYTLDKKNIITVTDASIESVDTAMKIWDAVSGNLLQGEPGIADVWLEQDYLITVQPYSAKVIHLNSQEVIGTITDDTIWKFDHVAYNSKIKSLITTARSDLLIWDLISKKNKKIKMMESIKYVGFVDYDSLILVVTPRSVQMININSGAVVNEHLYEGDNAFPHQHSNDILISDKSGGGMIMSTKNFDISRVLPGNYSFINLHAGFTKHDSVLYTFGSDSVVRFWDHSNLSLLSSVKIMSRTYSIDSAGRKLVEFGPQGLLKVWDIRLSKPLFVKKMRGFSNFSVSRNMAFHSATNKIAIAFVDSIFIVDAITGVIRNIIPQKMIESLPKRDKQEPCALVDFSPDGETVLVRQPVFRVEDGVIKRYVHSVDCNLYNINSGGLVSTKVENEVKVLRPDDPGFDDNVVFVSINGRYKVTKSKKEYLRVWDEVTASHKEFPISSDTWDVHINDKGDRLIALFPYENLIKIWNMESGELVATLIFIKDDFFAQSDDNYYFATAKAAKSLYYVTDNLQIISFDQLDIKYNRPDIILKKLSSPDRLLITSYHDAYLKRLKKLGLKPETSINSTSFPTATITNRENLPYKTDQKDILLEINAFDSVHALKRIKVWVNEVPVGEMTGLALSGMSKSLDTTVKVRLSTGENTIEISVINEIGLESYRMPLLIKYTPPVMNNEKLYFIGIGVNQYSDPKNNLNWSVKDIRDLALKFKSKFPNIIIDTLFDENVIKKNILQLKSKLQQLSEDDKVVISYSGHGLLSEDLEYYLSTYDTNFEKVEQNGLSYSDFENLLDGIKPRKKLMLIDACHSGEVDKEELIKVEGSKSELDNLGTTTTRSSRKPSSVNVSLSTSFELMRNVFVNVSRGTGATIISAAGGMQFAQERADLRNGVFTYSVLEAFNKHDKLTVFQLKKIVSDQVTQLTNGLQKPTARNETNNFDWQIW